MKLKQLQKALAVGVLAVTSSYALAVPSFSFTEYAGFQSGDVSNTAYTVAISGPAADLPSVGGLYENMAWNTGQSPMSSLNLKTFQGALVANTWTTISTLTHTNNVIPQATSWSGQDIFGRLKITDSDGGVS